VTRLNFVLVMAILASALYLVNVQYESRKLFTALDKSRAEAHRLESENERLQVEKRSQVTPLRLEKLAKERLQMRTVTPAITNYVTYKSDDVPALKAAP
jgi:cell division protein FtsL